MRAVFSSQNRRMEARNGNVNAAMAVVVLTLIFAAAGAGSTAVPPFSCDASNSLTSSFEFCNSELPVGTRVRDLISRLTLDEKISQLVNQAAAIPRLGVPYFQWWSEALHGVGTSDESSSAIIFDGNVTSATSFPQVIVTASAFDVHLWYRIGRAIGREARALYNVGHSTGLTFWAPNINVFRDPRWGRGQETPGEDPMTNSRYGVAFVRGIQGDTFEGGSLGDGHLLASACCKHLTAYDLENWNGFSRFSFDAIVTKQDMADTFQPPFKSCVEEGQVSGIMCAYNRVNGVPNCADYDLLTTTTRGKWGFRGYITSDCNAVSFIFEKHKYSASPEDAVALVLKAGIDLDCGIYLENHTRSAVEKGKVTESDIDRALKNLFTIRMRLGLFNGNPGKLPYSNLGVKDICSPQNQELALEAARHGIVLLKNSDNLLPLSKSRTVSLAVIGPNADDAQNLLGNYVGPPCKVVTPLNGLHNYSRKVSFHPGCESINCISAANGYAVEMARLADYVVLVMGLNQEKEAEDLDRTDLALPGEQESLIKNVARAAKRPVILVLISGGPVDVSFAKSDPKIGSILWAGYPGEAGGQAIAEIIFGDHNPGGRLAMTWYPRDFIGVPMNDMRMRPDPSSGYPGRTYRFFQGKPVFEFGYGLSYSNYTYTFASVTQNKILLPRSPATNNLENPIYAPVSDISSESCRKAKLSVVVHVKNDGKMAGKHPVLLFIRRETPKNGSPMKQLVAFQTVQLGAAEEANLEFVVNPCEQFAAANEDGVFVVESGITHLVVGNQEHPLRLTSSLLSSDV